MLKYVNYGVVFQEIPGETTLSINISGCPCKCKGCHSQYLWEDTGIQLDAYSLDDLLNKYGDDVTCVCFMGGDRDPELVNILAMRVKDKKPNLKVGWYSGKKHISSSVSIRNFDYIKTGPYIEELGGLKSRATNQRLYRIEGDDCRDITKMFWKDET